MSRLLGALQWLKQLQQALGVVQEGRRLLLRTQVPSWLQMAWASFFALESLDHIVRSRNSLERRFTAANTRSILPRIFLLPPPSPQYTQSPPVFFIRCCTAFDHLDSTSMFPLSLAHYVGTFFTLARAHIHALRHKYAHFLRLSTIRRERGRLDVGGS